MTLSIKIIDSNMTELTTHDGTQILFSYETPVAAHLVSYSDVNGFIKTTQQYSHATTKHIAKWLDGYPATAVTQATIDALVASPR
jgi:hypothetical protein